jgi:hypothetical protein
MFEPKASFCASRFVPDLFGNPEGAASRGRLSLLTFFGEAKKVSGCRAAPGNAPRSASRITWTIRTKKQEDKP